MKKFSSIFVFIIIDLLFITGCTNISYNAELYDNAINWINESFAERNLIRNVYYNVDDEENMFIIREEICPVSRTFIINNEDTYNEILTSEINDWNIDFATKMLVVYTFRGTNNRKLKLVTVKKQASKLIIEYKHESKTGTGDTSVPYQRWIIIKLDKESFTSVDISEK